jgi:ribonuclease VapC
LDADAFILMTEVNYAEFKYQMLRKQGREVWAQCESEFETLPVLVLPVTRSLSDQAAEYKAAHKMSLADAFAAALAKERDATLVTGDPEFKPLAKEIRIKWLKA